MARTLQPSTLLFLLFAGGLVLLFLDPWRPMDLAGPDEIRALAAVGGEPTVERLLPPVPPEAERRPLPGGAGATVRFVDAVTRKPLAGVQVLRDGRRLLGVSGGEGSLVLPPGTPPGRLLFRCPGYLGVLLGLDTPWCAGLRRRLAAGELELGLAPDPITVPLYGTVKNAAGAAVDATVTLQVDPGEAARRPARPVPDGLRGAWRLAWTVEALCRPALCAFPWELGATRPRVETRSIGERGYGLRTLSKGPFMLRATDAAGGVCRLKVYPTRPMGVGLTLRPGSWLKVTGVGRASLTATGADGWVERTHTGERVGPWTPGESVRLTVPIPGGEHTREVKAPPAGETLEVDLGEVAAGRLWQGRVVMAGSGRAVAGARLTWLGLAGPPAVSARDGRFRLFLPADKPVRLQVTAPDAVERSWLLPAEGPLPPTVEVMPAGAEAQVAAGLVVRLAGRVLADGGRPVPGARVTARRLRPREPGGLVPTVRTAARTDDRGAYTLRLESGTRWRIGAMHLVLGWGEVVVAGGGRPGTVPDIRLVRQGAAAGVVTVGGAPAGDALLLFESPGRPSAQGRTGADGAFKVPLPAPGRWTVNVQWQGRKWRRAVEVPAAGSPDLRLDF